MLALSLCESHLILPLGVLLSVAAVVIILSRNKDDYSFSDKMGSKVKGCGPSTEKFAIPNSSHHFVPTHPRHPWLLSGSNWIDVLQICCLKLCLDFLWRLLNFIQIDCSPSCIFHTIVPHEIKNNLLEYVGVQILDSLSARMRQQPNGVDHLHCGTKTLHWVAI